jgi:NADH-ubiquinone oxidoreductase chain 1
MTEHAAVIFVFFFLAEYASIVLICILNTVLFLGGYIFDYSLFSYVLNLFYFTGVFPTTNFISTTDIFSNNPLLEGLIYGLSLGIKSCVMIFVFI